MCCIAPGDVAAATDIVMGIDLHIGRFVTSTLMLEQALSLELAEYLRLRGFHQTVFGCSDQSNTPPYEISPLVQRHLGDNKFNVSFMHAFVTVAVTDIQQKMGTLTGRWECTSYQVLHELRNALSHNGRWQRERDWMPASVARYTLDSQKVGRRALYVEWDESASDGMWPGDVVLLLEEIKQHLLRELNRIRVSGA